MSKVFSVGVGAGGIHGRVSVGRHPQHAAPVDSDEVLRPYDRSATGRGGPDGLRQQERLTGLCRFFCGRELHNDEF